mgnify:CR=1 FL=1
MKQTKICKDLSFEDCELAILRMAVDKAEEKIGKRIVNSDEVQQIIRIVENFIKTKKLICLSGYVDAPPTTSWTHPIREIQAILRSVEIE